MKKSLERHLPHEILYRRKMGFVTPISAWFRGPLAGHCRCDRQKLGAGRTRLVQ
jgi:asparagine synthase (glutamine-hydrolysing)